MRRRRFITQSLAFTVSLTLSGFSKRLLATWQAEDFAAGGFDLSFNRLMSDKLIQNSEEISISLPKIAENGAVVPITVASELDNIDKLYVWVEKNPTPLASIFELSPAVAVYITARIKMAESCNVIVLARQGQRWLRCQQWVQVMQGGCGTG